MPESVEIKINGEEWRDWSSVELTRSVDSFSTVAITSLWDPSREDMREAFRPYQRQPVEVFVGGELFLTGVLITPDPESSKDENTISANGYGLPGALYDSNMPASSYPLELNRQKIDAIARKLAKPFGLSVEFESTDLGAKFDRVELAPTDKPWSKLAEWGKERGILFSDSERGALVGKKLTPGSAAVEILEHGIAPLQSIRATFDGQGVPTEITALANARIGTKGGKFTIKNPMSAGGPVALVFAADKSERGDLPRAAKSKLGRIVAASASWRAVVPTWRNRDGQIWTCGDLVSVLAPHAMIFKRSDLMIRGVQFIQDKDAESSVLELCLRESFTEEAPEVLPWE